MKDRATAYAKSVLSGKILAGPIVKAACQRHLNDLKYAGERGFYYDRKGAAEAIAFFEEVLYLSAGQYEGKKFLLFPWEDFIIGSLFGWKRKIDDMRRFNVAYIEGPKGCGKSPLAGGIGLKGLCADSEARAEIYAAATKQAQAMILFRDAVAMYEQSELLNKRLIPSGVGEKCWNLSHLESGSFFRAISSEKKGQSGPKPHFVLLDEIHEHPDNNVIEMLRAGFKFRRQPLSFMITNSGSNMASICREYHDMGEKIAKELIQNDEFFAYICSLDDEDLKDDKYLTDESLWPKVNPSLEYGLPGYDYIRGQVREAQGMSSKMSTVKRLCFCVWSEASDPWLSSRVWMPCQDKGFDYSRLVGRRCWGGLDLSAVNDLTSFGLIFEPEVQAKVEKQENGKNRIIPFTPEEIQQYIDDGKDPYFRLVVWFWMPNYDLSKKSQTDHVPYDTWYKQGHIFTCEGRAISKTQVIRFIYNEVAKYELIGIAYDRNRMKDLIEFANKEGIDLAIGKWDKDKREWDFDSPDGLKMMPFGQEARSMSPAIDKFETMLLKTQIMHNGNPCLNWCAANAVVTKDDIGYRKMSKLKSVGRIDGIVASVMACGILDDIGTRSAYEGLTVEGIVKRMAL